MAYMVQSPDVLQVGTATTVVRIASTPWSIAGQTNFGEDMYPESKFAVLPRYYATGGGGGPIASGNYRIQGGEWQPIGVSG